MSLIGGGSVDVQLDIYNSRNYMSLIGFTSIFSIIVLIYNSRNYMSLIGTGCGELRREYLQ